MANDYLIAPTEPVADEPTARERGASELRAEYEAEQDESDRNDSWGMP